MTRLLYRLLSKKIIAKGILILFLLGQASTFSLFFPKKIDAGNLTSVSATLGNSRLSFFGKTNGAHTAGTTTVSIQSSSNADNNTNNLFPRDDLAIGINGGLKVASVSASVNATSFIIDQALPVTVATATNIYASQSGSLVVSFTLANDIPASGYLYITIPANATTPNDKAPDTSTSTDTNGFDANGIGTGDWSVAGGDGCTWDSAETWTVGSSGNPHIYKNVTSTLCTGGTVVVTLDASPGLMNPAPITTGHSQGTADTYKINVYTYTAGDAVIDSGFTKVAPIEGVLVTATIESTITFTVAGVNSGTSTCGQTTTVTTYPYLIPFGSLSSPNIATASQKLTVSTNAASYVVTLQENDQLSIDGLGTTTIADAICDDGSCTHTTAADWKTGYNPAKGNFGYSLANVSGSDASFLYNDSSRVFSAKQIAEIVVDFTPPATNPPTIMTQSTPVNASQIYTCFMLAFQATQQAGYYFNKLKYTATPTF